METLGFAVWQEGRMVIGEAMADLSGPVLTSKPSQWAALQGKVHERRALGVPCTVSMLSGSPLHPVGADPGTIWEALGEGGHNWGRSRKKGQSFPGEPWTGARTPAQVQPAEPWAPSLVQKEDPALSSPVQSTRIHPSLLEYQFAVREKE